MEDFTKVCRIGKQHRIGSTFISIKWHGGRLSITGVEGPTYGGDCRGACGQINMDGLGPFDEYAPGWTLEAVAKLSAIWDEHHLNGMAAGSPAQTAHLATLPKWVYGTEGFKSHYDWALAKLAEAGLQPDNGYQHNGKAYSYGSAWLKREVPEEVLQWLHALPDADITPAWV